jgi:hypothetical protein
LPSPQTSVEFDARSGHIPGLSLLDLEPYGGTILYDPGMTPINSVAFATTCGDDVHFGLLAVEGKCGDSSPIVMTVPMAGGSPEEANFILRNSPTTVEARYRMPIRGQRRPMTSQSWNDSEPNLD